MSSEEPKKRKIVVVEGPDFSGKSTMVEGLKKAFGDKCKSYSRPGGFEDCNDLREIISESKNIGSHSRQMLAAFEAALFHENLKKSSEEISILDRYNVISGMIYGPPEIVKAYRVLLFDWYVPEPDLIVYMDTSVEEILSRAKSRGAVNHMDKVFLDKVEEIHEKYRILMEELSNCGLLVFKNSEVEKLMEAINTL